MSKQDDSIWRLKRILTLRWSDTDAYGHVNHAVMLRFFEEARLYFLQTLLPQTAIEIPMIFVRQCQCRYFHSLTYPNDIVIETVLSEVRGARMFFDARIICKDLCMAESITETVWINPVTQKPTRVPAEFLTMLTKRTWL